MRRRHRLRMIPEIVAAAMAWLILPFLPRRAIVGLSRMAGTLAWRFARRERRISAANLELAFGTTLSPDEREAIAKTAFQHIALTFLDLFWFSRFFPSRYRRYVRLSPAFQQALQHAPLIGVTGHLGNWELLRAACGMQGVPMTAVAMPLKNPVVDRILARLRKKTGATTVPRAGAVRTLMRCLREGGATGLVLDQNTLPSEGGIFVPFFGLPVAVSNVAGLLAAKTQASLLVTAAIPDDKGVYDIVTHALLSPDGKTPEDVTAAITRELEGLIRAYPSYWLWAYKRWHFYRDGDPIQAFPFYANHVQRAKRKQ